MFKALCLVLLATAVANADITQCLQDVEALIPVVKALAEDIETGNIAQAIADAEAAIPDVEKAIADCTNGLATPEITPNCVTDLINLIPVLEQIVNDVEVQDWVQVVNDILNAVPEVEAAIADCTAKEISLEKVTRALQSSTCINDLLACLPYLEKIVEDIDTGDYIKLIQDALAAIQPLETAIEACVAEGESEYESGVAEATPANCVSDVEAVVAAVRKVIADYKAGNSWEMDAIVAVMDATHAYGDCSTVDPIQLLEYIYTLLTSDEQACVNSVVEVGSSGYKLYVDVKSGVRDVQTIVDDVTTIVDGVDDVVDTCKCPVA